MSISAAIVLYAVLWFLTLFVVLPLRLTTQGDAGEIVPGTPAGAPVEANLKKKAKIVTIVASVLWAVLFTIIVTGAITVRDFDVMNRLGDLPADGTGE
jgi:predicted secreted protein